MIKNLLNAAKRGRKQCFKEIKANRTHYNTARFFSLNGHEPEKDAVEREQMDYDVLIVGGGPAGLSAAIRLKQLCQEKGQDLSVCLIEKGAAIGAHILSGNVFQPIGLNELLPNWKEKMAPLNTPVTKDRFMIFTEKSSFTIPNFLLPKTVVNHGNYIISLGDLAVWLGEQAEEMGVDILPGIAGDKIIFNKKGSVEGVITGDMGIAKDGSQKSTYQPGIAIRAKQTIFTEGCRGSLTLRLMKHFELDKDNTSVQQYGIGFKEIWQVAEGNPHFEEGLAQHTILWPLPSDVYGGSYLYHMKPNLIHLGLVIGLDYENPYFNPYEEFQKLKTHKEIRKLLEGGECISYGARCLNEGAFHAIPKLTFPGGMLAGDSAGFLNVAKVKGAHNAIKSGMIAAESIFQHVTTGKDLSDVEITTYEKNVKDSWIWSEMKKSRNFKGGFDKGLWFGLIHGWLISHTQGKEPWTIRDLKRDCDSTKPKSEFTPIEYPKHDGVLTFDLLDNLVRTGTSHDHDQPSHLRVKKGMERVPTEVSHKIYGAPEERFCPAKVYEFVHDEKTNQHELQINAQNCIHCKCCSIKTPQEYIDWNVPEGGGGPAYFQNMSASLTQKLGKSLVQSRSVSLGSRTAKSAASPHSGAVVNYTQQHGELTSKWLNRLRATANTSEGRDQLGQIYSVLEFFNKQSHNHGLAPVKWEEWEQEIHTKGVVGKIKTKYDNFMKAEYNVESAVGQVGHQTEKMKALEVANTYNYMLYLAHYAGHLEQLETLKNIGDVQEISNLEMYHLCPGVDSLLSSEQEIGNISPPTLTEDGIFTRICTQFSWGSRYNPPFVHSSDALNAVVATFAKLGK